MNNNPKKNVHMKVDFEDVEKIDLAAKQDRRSRTSFMVRAALDRAVGASGEKNEQLLFCRIKRIKGACRKLPF